MPNCQRYQLWMGSLLSKRNDLYCCTVVDTWQKDDWFEEGLPLEEFDNMEDGDRAVDELNGYKWDDEESTCRECGGEDFRHFLNCSVWER